MKNENEEEFGIKITKAAIERIVVLKSKNTENNEENEYGLRIFVDSGGCSGFQYNFELISSNEIKTDTDYVFEK